MSRFLTKKVSPARRWNPAGTINVRSSSPRELYSTFADQLGAKAHSMPAPTSQPLLVLLLEAVIDVPVVRSRRRHLERHAKLPRRNFLHLAAGAAALPAVSRIARAQSYPTRPVRLIVAVAPGGGADILARLMGHWLSERLGQQLIIDNRPGGGGNIGTEAVVRAPADGYTLLLCSVVNATNAAFYDKLNFDFIHDIAPVATLTRQPYVIVVNPSVPAKSVPEFIAYAKANPSRISFGSAGIGGSNHLVGELFKVLPDVPTVGEFVPGYEASSWYGLGAPKATPAEIVEKLNTEVNAALADPKMKA